MSGQYDHKARRNRELGDKISQLRRKKGWTRDQLAEKAQISVGVIKKLEWGGTASINSYHAIADALGMELVFSASRAAGLTRSDSLDASLITHATPPATLAHAYSRSHPTALPGQWLATDREDSYMYRRQFIMLTALASFGMPEHIQALFAAGRCPQLTEELVHDVAILSESHLLQQDASSGGGAVCDVAIAMHDTVRAWLHQGGQSVGVIHALERFSGDLGAWAGWLATDAGRHQAAYHYLQETIAQARIADCPGSELHALENSCILLNLLGSPQRSLQTAQTALRIAGPNATPRLQAVFHMRAARAHAHLKNGPAFQHHTDEAYRTLERATGQHEPAWTYFLRPSTLDALTGVSLMELGATSRAVTTLQGIIGRRDPDLRRAHAYYTVQLALALTQEGDSENAGKVALAVLPDVLELSSEWIRRDLCRLRNRLSRTPNASHQARDFVGLYDEAIQV